MLESVLGMYSVPAGPLWRNLSSGVLTASALKVAGSIAQQANNLGWHVILMQAGDKKASAEVTKSLIKEGYSSLEILVVLRCLLSDRRCQACHGTGKVWSPRGHRYKNCDRCQASGSRPIPVDRLVSDHGVDKANVERALNVCLIGQADAEKAIALFLKKEREDLQ